MGLNLQIANLLVIRMGCGSELVEKKPSDCITSVLTRGQANGMDHQDLGKLTLRPVIMIR